MQDLGRAFFISALLYGVLGMLLGLEMAIGGNHGQMPTHAHVMVIGWLSFAVFGLFYSQFGHAAPKVVARLHFWLAQLSLAGLVVGLWLVYSGRPQYEPIAAISSLAYAASFLAFVVVAMMAMRARTG